MLIIVSSNEVTLNSSYCWEYTQVCLKSGFFEILLICLDARGHATPLLG